ncbi:MAG: glycosyltransferase [Methylomicrobium sp.]|nr:glycosyltransferase [Methylomicrobium sp.]
MTNNAPLITVIVPCYNQARYLTDAIHSIKNQTYEKWECIIVNDGSTDNTAQVATELSKTDNRIKVINQKNKGLSGARNAGLDVAFGDYIQFLDADDKIREDKFSLQLRALLSTNSLCLCYSDYLMGLDEDICQTPLQIQRSPSRLVMRNALYDVALRWETRLSIPVHCFLFDARFFSEFNIRFDQSLPNHEDWDCWMRIFALAPETKVVPEALAIYRKTSDSLCKNKEAMYMGFKQAIVKQHNNFNKNITVRILLKYKIKELEKYYISKKNLHTRAIWILEKIL